MQRYDDEFDWAQKVRENMDRHEKAIRFSQRMVCFAIFFVGFCAGIVTCAIVHEVMK